MTKSQINCFLAVVQELSFTKAANILYISQPAISKSVSTLEEELGFKLFERRDNILHLTEAGKLMSEFFIKSSNEFHELIDSIERLDSVSSPPVRIGCPDTWNPTFFREKMLKYFSAAHPGMRLSIECCKLSELIIRLKSGRLDVVLTHDFYSPNQYGISSEYLTSTGCGILYSRDHFKSVHTLEDFRSSRFLLYDNDIQKKFEGVIRNICSGLFTPTFFNTGQLSTALFDMACGKGVMLFSDWDSAVSNSAYGFLPVNKRLPIRILYHTDGRSPSVTTFIEDMPALFS